ncbi:glycosyltransferase [Deltaproteobacteria bacterium]|nr:glycosyltransferase [Deltaproteobacteria bacterium]
MDISLIITTYNWPEALKLTLVSVLNQSVRPGEIIIADDGSGPETGMVIKEVLDTSDSTWCHVRHDNSGIRQARIKNLAVRYSHAQYLVLIDHDVVLHPDFIADHLAMAREGTFLQGKRVFLSEYLTKKYLSDFSFSPPSPFSRGLNNRKNAFRLRLLGKMITRPKDFQTILRGCNLSMHREDFLRVDGYDETFDQLWGREDSDICYRLFHSGVKIRNLWFSALQYHLEHKVIKKKDRDRLDDELDRICEEKRTRAIKGFSQLSREGEIVGCSDSYYKQAAGEAGE